MSPVRPNTQQLNKGTPPPPLGGGGARLLGVLRAGMRMVQQRKERAIFRRFAKNVKLSHGTLNRFNVTAATADNKPCVMVPYIDLNNNTVFERYLTVTGSVKADHLVVKKTPAFYSPKPVGAFPSSHAIAIVNSEIDAIICMCHGIAAIGLPGPGQWDCAWDQHLMRFNLIYVVEEKDTWPTTVLWLARSQFRGRIHAVKLEGFQSLREMHLRNPGKFKKRWDVAKAKAIPLWKHDDAPGVKALRLAYGPSRKIATQPDILSSFGAAIEKAGLAGEKRNAQILFLALVSRVLDDPVSVVVKGPSAAGKSSLVEKVLGFFPDSSYRKITSLSERALYYSRGTLKHRFLVFTEAAGMKRGSVAYQVRVLLSEGVLKYFTGERNDDGSQGREYVVEGPVGLISTTTEIFLHPENETRCLSLSTDDTPEQTRQVLRSEAREDALDVNYPQWHALQEFLSHYKLSIVIPYAEVLAEEVNISNIRIRRDFPTVLSLIRAHTLLHHHHRTIDEDGRLVATIKDYAKIRDLLEPALGEGIEASISDTMRETIQAVSAAAGIHGASVNAVAEKLGLDKSSTSRRLKEAIGHGHVYNLERRRGVPARHVLGDPLPNDRFVLPLPDEIA